MVRDTPFDTMEEVAAYVGGDTIECLECGKHFRMITGKHLQLKHGMTQDEYRERWGLPKTLGLATADLKSARAAQTRQMHADGILSSDHLPTASDPQTRRPMTPKVPATRRAHSDMVRQLRPGDHAKLPAGAKRADGRDSERAREYQRALRAMRAGDNSPMREYIRRYSGELGGRFYTIAEEQTIRELHAEFSAAEIGYALGRSASSVAGKIRELGLPAKVAPWAPNDDDFLRVNYLERGAEWVAAQLGRTDESVRARASALRVRGKIGRPDGAVDGTGSYIHLRVTPDTKSRWIRESRAAGIRLAEWIILRVERSDR